MVLIALAVSMSLLLLIGVAVALASAATGSNIGAAVAGLVIIAGGVALLIRRDLLLRFAQALVRWSRRVLHRRRGSIPQPTGSIGARIEATLARMREIPLSARSTAWIVVVAGWVWFFDFLCLTCAFSAVHARIPWAGVLLAYGAAQVAGALPFIPGGLGVVEGSMAAILTAYGAGRVPAISAVLAYRLVSFWFFIAVGWVAAGLIAYQERRRRARDVALARREALIPAAAHYSARKAEALRALAAQPAGSSAPATAIAMPASASSTSSQPR
jgi:putative heme transporter